MWKPAAAAAMLFAAAGCSPGPRTAAPVEPEKARAALRAALDAWKAGEPPEALGRAAPPVVVQDLDWSAGAKLTGYELVGDGAAEDANLRVRVKLALRGPQGAAVRTVSYVVGTDPTLTVFRAME